jgi:hypothetical protein
MAESNKRFILDVCEEFHDIFYLEGDKLSHTDLVKHSIPTPAIDENRVINVRPYTLPEAHKEEVNRQIDKLLGEGITAPCCRQFLGICSLHFTFVRYQSVTSLSRVLCSKVKME